ncbi:ECF RNA polymerase sigma factor SigW [Stieleria neptunia]|uniref:ECF RNA polymerase sigma factor SigW n=2 Tax=Stieleria neptunia TaxID=2527979 RepID=A0A518HZQ1_9BACT|nr:ECF RNA polymerase sigma factor SigW [Stieleria neptunia]
MDAAFDSLFEDRRVYQRTSTRRASMEKSLTQPEFARAVSAGLPKLIAIARRLSGDEDIAAEAVQNALLKASKSWRKFRGQSHVDTWLTKIVIHAVRDGMASQRRHLEHNEPKPQAPSERQCENLVDPERGPSQQVLDAEIRNAVAAAVRELPDRQREVFSLMIWQSMTARDVGQLLDITPQTVHANLHAARKRLRELLGPFVSDDQD